jgi:hypothetical protein
VTEVIACLMFDFSRLFLRLLMSRRRTAKPLAALLRGPEEVRL